MARLPHHTSHLNTGIYMGMFGFMHLTKNIIVIKSPKYWFCLFFWKKKIVYQIICRLWEIRKTFCKAQNNLKRAQIPFFFNNKEVYMLIHESLKACIYRLSYSTHTQKEQSQFRIWVSLVTWPICWEKIETNYLYHK